MGCQCQLLKLCSGLCCWLVECSALCAGMMITTLVSYLSHSQIWALERDGQLHVGGKSNRAAVGFSSELNGMLRDVPQTGSAPQKAAAPQL